MEPTAHARDVLCVSPAATQRHHDCAGSGHRLHRMQRRGTQDSSGGTCLMREYCASRGYGGRSGVHGYGRGLPHRYGGPGGDGFDSAGGSKSDDINMEET